MERKKQRLCPDSSVGKSKGLTQGPRKFAEFFGSGENRAPLRAFANSKASQKHAFRSRVGGSIPHHRKIRWNREKQRLCPDSSVGKSKGLTQGPRKFAEFFGSGENRAPLRAFANSKASQKHAFRSRVGGSIPHHRKIRWNRKKQRLCPDSSVGRAKD